ncbi:ribonuclease H [Golden Marseillevirus]|uniref:Rnase H n=1 Tax=Golden Marseillevirus TaxID=1720526 RepID=UPI000877A907|nr:Rnase H [Golden Marseillevirus]ALX27671.1 ribonuclease H [Golden Marseillevirus]
MNYFAYTDGSCLKNPGHGGYGAVILDSLQNLVQELSGPLPNTTNNKAEMTAVIKVLEFLPPNSSCTVYTDSQYVSKGMNEWMSAWKKNGWRTSARKPVQNVELWKTLDSLREMHHIEFVWIERSSSQHNVRADRLANSEAQKLETIEKR